jgi:hypothetical protein
MVGVVTKNDMMKNMKNDSSVEPVCNKLAGSTFSMYLFDPLSCICPHICLIHSKCEVTEKQFAREGVPEH